MFSDLADAGAQPSNVGIGDTHRRALRSFLLFESTQEAVSTDILNAALRGERRDNFDIAETTFVGLGNRQTPVTLAEVRAAMEKKVELNTTVLKELPTSEAWAKVLAGTASDAEYQEVYPPRTSSDLAIRRGRIHDVAVAYRDDNLTALWRRVVTMGARCGWDIIMTTMISAMVFIRVEWLDEAEAIGLLPATLAEYTDRAKQVSVIVKTRDTVLPLTYWAEPAVLTGYRQPPMPGFSLEEEARVLAEDSGRELGGGVFSFDDAAEQALSMHNTGGEYVPFADFVASGEWVTGGASSVGKVYATVDGKPIHFKARKNLVRELFSDDELVKLAMAAEQVNVAIIKSELAKIRLAVAGDLGTYLLMAWVTKLLGGAYKQWPGSTTEETLSEQSDRLVRMITALAKLLGIPFDFKGFDHQPTLEQLLKIVSILLRVARRAVPAAGLTEFDTIAARIVTGFRRAVLRFKDGNKEGSFKMKNGLASGLGWTSILGNAWNTVVTFIVELALRSLGISDAIIERWIRGDDTAAFSDSWVKAALVVEGYRWMGAEGGMGKFSIWRGACEFLRQWITRDGVSAYGVRSLPGWFQRKPWGVEPWRPAALICAVAEVRDTLVRRGWDATRVWRLWNATRRVWCKKARVSPRWLELPVSCGGLGLEPWKGWFPDKPFPVPELPVLAISNSNGREFSTVERECAAIGGGDVDEMRKIANARVVGRMVSDSVPHILKLLKKPEYNAKWHKKVVAAQPGDENPNAASMPAAIGAVDVALAGNQNWFGYARRAFNDWSLWSELEPATGVKPLDLFRKVYPNDAAVLAKLEARGLRRRDALDWLFGTTVFTLAGANPVVGSIVSAFTRKLIGAPGRRSWRDAWREHVYVYSVYCAKRLSTSPWYKTLFSW